MARMARAGRMKPAKPNHRCGLVQDIAELVILIGGGLLILFVLVEMTRVMA